MGWANPRALLATVLLLSAATGAVAEDRGLVWHAERLGGEVLSSHRASEKVNPASVTKVATALFALETLGAGHRYETAFGLAGDLNEATGTLDGDLVVIGGHDPDFQLESALLVARRLNELGLRRVTGAVVVDDAFWMGWEHGSERREPDRDRRAQQMAERLRRALDPDLWSEEDWSSWRGWMERDPSVGPDPPRIQVSGGARSWDGEPPAPTVIHRSNPLSVILKRFLAYSNNDIERITDPLGGASVLEDHLRRRLHLEDGAIGLATTSGLGPNRVSSALVVRMLREFRLQTLALGLEPGDLLPMPGCDPGSLESALPSWQEGERRAAMASKTGTLIREDGGVAALAGFLYGVDDTVVFMVAAPRSGPRIRQAQRDIEAWATEMVARVSGPSPQPCGAPVAQVEAEAQVTSPQ